MIPFCGVLVSPVKLAIMLSGPAVEKATVNVPTPLVTVIGLLTVGLPPLVVIFTLPLKLVARPP